MAISMLPNQASSIRAKAFSWAPESTTATFISSPSSCALATPALTTDWASSRPMSDVELIEGIRAALPFWLCAGGDDKADIAALDRWGLCTHAGARVGQPAQVSSRARLVVCRTQHTLLRPRGEKERTTMTPPRSRVSGAHLHKYDPQQQSQREDADLSAGQQAEGFAKPTLIRRLIGLFGGVGLALLIFAIMPGDIEMWPRLTAATAVLMRSEERRVGEGER